MESGRGERERGCAARGGAGMERVRVRGRGGTVWQLNPPRPVYWGVRLIEQQHTNARWQPGLQGGCPASIHRPASALMHCVCVCVWWKGDRKISECVCSYHGSLCREGWSPSLSLWMIPGQWHCHITWLCCPWEPCPVGWSWSNVEGGRKKGREHEQVIKSLLTSHQCCN